jgi:thymidylate synthase (FAD)
MPLSSEQQAEIDHLRSEAQETRRAVAPALEEILYKEIKVLDHGFLRVVDYMGSDEAIVQAARVSYGKGTKKVSEDKGLIGYLMRHRHSTPFEMCEIKFHVKLPIFIARQWIRHRTANVNEYSARYSILDKEFYFPDIQLLRDNQAIREKEKKHQKIEKRIEERKGLGQDDFFGVPDNPELATEVTTLASQSKTNKQGREKAVTQDEALDAVQLIERQANSSYKAYRALLNETTDGSVIDPERTGIARELARMVLPANVYTQWYWKVDLHNLMHFISLRADPHAQHEIRVYADEMLNVLRRWVPLTADAFEQYRMHAKTLSKDALEVVRRKLKGETVTLETSGLGKREWSELQAVLNGEH